MTMILDNLYAVNHQIQQACSVVQRETASVKLVAVSKTFGIDSIREAFSCGQHDFGENYVQEALAKIAALQDLLPSIRWHFIGALQSNKIKHVAKAFDWVHSVDRATHALHLSQHRPSDTVPLNVLIQVNTSQELTKNGVAEDEIVALSQCIVALPGLRLRGLMALPAPSTDPLMQKSAHQHLKRLFDALRTQALAEDWPHAHDIDTLSMGMSADLTQAIVEGSTMVRIGTAIFGNRPSPATL